MDIQINKNWKISSIDMNVTLQRRTKPSEKKPEGSWRTVGNFVKIEHALDRLFDENIYTSDATEFLGIKADIERLRQEVVNAFSKNIS